VSASAAGTATSGSTPVPSQLVPVIGLTARPNGTDAWTPSSGKRCMSTGWAVVRPHALEEAALHGLLVDLLLRVQGLGRHRHHPQVQVMADRLRVLGELLGKRRQGVEFVVGLLAEPLAQVGVPPAPWAATAAARAADRTNMTTGFFTVNLLSRA
jgi:hypothetical protein